MFPREVEGRKTMHALDRPKDLSAQFCDSLEFLVKWDKCMYLALAGISASTIAVHIWAMFTMNR
ncbi:transmembrane protein, putative [Medicago truncatula]|nr:transmembrane protein, putative [Medicago truncatula]